MKLFLFLALLLPASAAVCQKTVNLTAYTPFAMPPTLQPSENTCTYAFNVPSGYYALLSFSATDLMEYEDVTVNDHFGDKYYFGTGFCNSSCAPISSVLVYPSYFFLNAYTLRGTRMRLQINVSLRQLDLSMSAGTITVGNNTPSSVVYFRDWKQGTTFTVTSSTKSVYLKAAIPELPYNLGNPYNNVFIFDGGNNVGTLEHAYQYGYVSKTNTIQLFLANTMNFPGAFLVTDYSNVSPLQSYFVEYVPVTSGSTTVSMQGSDVNQIEGSVTVIGENDGSTPLTITRLGDFGEGGLFTYMHGGPLSSHKNLMSPLTKLSLPTTINGTLTTFYVSSGPGEIWISVPN